jgi:ABC-type branched-subunit amino acid transport system substrate-binding protein
LVAFGLASCGDDGNSSSGGGGGGANSAAKSLLKDDGACDSSLAKYNVGILTVIESPTLSLKSDSVGLTAAIQAFNARGGVGKHCMELEICDSKGDPNIETDCARQMVDHKVVATLSDATPFATPQVKEIMEAANIPRVGLSQGTQDLSSTVAYSLDVGGAGTTFMMVPGCATNGLKKIAAIHVDTPQILPLFGALAGMLKAYDATMDTKLPLAAGTTDFQQFTLSAQSAGANCAIIPLGQNEAVQVLQAAQQLGSDLKFSGSAASFNADNLKQFGDFNENIIFNSALPPANASQERWPILGAIIDDLGEPADKILPPEIRSWLSVYALKTIVEQYGTPDDISSAAITKAMKAAKDVDMFGLVPPWTPSFSASPSFKAVSQPWYYVMTFDKDGKPVIQDKQYNVINELTGVLDYDHKPSVGASNGVSSAAPGSSGAPAKS